MLLPLDTSHSHVWRTSSGLTCWLLFSNSTSIFVSYEPYSVWMHGWISSCIQLMWNIIWSDPWMTLIVDLAFRLLRLSIISSWFFAVLSIWVNIFILPRIVVVVFLVSEGFCLSLVDSFLYNVNSYSESSYRIALILADGFIRSILFVGWCLLLLVTASAWLRRYWADKHAPGLFCVLILCSLFIAVG